jgi:hypothetical protein
MISNSNIFTLQPRVEGLSSVRKVGPLSRSTAGACFIRMSVSEIDKRQLCKNEQPSEDTGHILVALLVHDAGRREPKLTIHWLIAEKYAYAFPPWCTRKALNPPDDKQDIHARRYRLHCSGAWVEQNRWIHYASGGYLYVRVGTLGNVAFGAHVSSCLLSNN